MLKTERVASVGDVGDVDFILYLISSFEWAAMPLFRTRCGGHEEAKPKQEEVGFGERGKGWLLCDGCRKLELCGDDWSGDQRPQVPTTPELVPC
jgi:hypothetical protein